MTENEETPVPELEGEITIPYKMLLDLCHDARWRVTGNRDPKSITIYHRFHGNHYDIKDKEGGKEGLIDLNDLNEQIIEEIIIDIIIWLDKKKEQYKNHNTRALLHLYYALIERKE
jgi:hypothetical protein